jgi:methyl-accepting chemotaxis protein
VSFVVSVSVITGINAYLSNQIQSSKALEERLTVASNQFKDLRYHVVQIQQFLTDVSATHERDGFADAKENWNAARKELAALLELTPEFSDTIKQISNDVEILEQTGEEMANAYIESGIEAGNAIMKRPQTGFDDRSDALSKQLDHLSDDLLARLSLSRQELETITDRGSFLSIVFSILVLIIGLSGYFIMYRRILPPLDRLKSSLSELVSGDGDLTRRLPIKNTDELGKIVEQFNAFIHVLHGLVRSVAQSSTPLSQTSQDMKEASEKAKHGALQQEQETHKVSSAITEMTAAVTEVARNAAVTMEETKIANKKAHDGRAVVEIAMDSINELAKEVSGSAEVIGRLESYSNDIDKILVTIKGIAEQTNLLALNAAIEAARAGEQGRGFAVVADEVRSLASRTHESTTEIQQMVEHLQKTAREAVAVMTRSQEKAKQGVERASQAGNALAEITQSVTTIADMSAQIATSSEEQSAVAEEIHRNIVAINDIASVSVKSASESADAAKSLATLSEDLSKIVKQFRV